MNHRIILHTLGEILILLAILMLAPLLVCFINREKDYLCFVIPILWSLLLGLGLNAIKVKDKTFYAKEGFVMVGCSWIMLSLIGALPFVLTKTIPNYIDAFFETVSGFTTTGSSILDGHQIELLNTGHKGILFWRSFTHWIGGMGVLVFILAILPSSGGDTIHILRAESTGPQVGKIVSKMRFTARILYLIYIALTVLEIILLAFDPSMTFFEAITHALATAGTGGFSTRGASIGAFDAYAQIVIAIFMLLFGVNFNIYYLILARKFKQAFKSEELWCYIGIIIVSVLAISLNIFITLNNIYTSFGKAFLDSFFQVSSIITTTGYATTSFETWPKLSLTILFMLMFVGGCAGSTGGGIKVSRFIILTKAVRRDINKLIHPHAVSNVKFEGTTLDEKTIKGVYSYFGIIFIIFFICLTLISLDNFSLETNITAVTACINNIGPGLTQMIGPNGCFADFSYFSKMVLIFAMLVGRLEVYPIIMLFNPRLWLNK